MNTSKQNYYFISSPIFNHIVFWIGVLLYFTLSVNITNYSGYQQLLESTVAIVGLQIVTAYTTIYFLIPKYLNKKKPIVFTIWLIILLILMYACYTLFKTFYYDLKYYEFFNPIAKKYAIESYWVRFTNFSVLLSKAIKFLTPATLLIMSQFYKDRQRYLTLNEQKKTAELTALKHQLNPHFLFNTLNNLYSLSLKKSDQAPEVIEKLSDILDYMLYRCKDTFVLLQKEVELIENYLALEKVRYGKRVCITFNIKIQNEVKIAPLMLLTFVENAFKHGVSQELKVAYIGIEITIEKEQIIFLIQNSKPVKQDVKNNMHCIGLSNIKKQLELLYTNKYTLEIKDAKELYTVLLKIDAK